jgi:hypothetical protein
MNMADFQGFLEVFAAPPKWHANCWIGTRTTFV